MFISGGFVIATPNKFIFSEMLVRHFVNMPRIFGPCVECLIQVWAYLNILYFSLNWIAVLGYLCTGKPKNVEPSNF